MNRCILGGTISSYGVRLTYTQAAKPQLGFALTLTEGDYHTFVPCSIVGPQAEVLAETLEAGDYCLLEGKLSWKKEQSKLIVVAFGVERLSTGTREDAPEYQHEGAEPIVEPEPSQVGKPRKPRLPKHLKQPWVPSGLVSSEN